MRTVNEGGKVLKHVLLFLHKGYDYSGWGYGNNSQGGELSQTGHVKMGARFSTHYHTHNMSPFSQPNKPLGSPSDETSETRPSNNSTD